MDSGSIVAIEIPSIIEEGSRDELVNLEGGGRIHLRLSFILTDVERKKIELMVRTACSELQATCPVDVGSERYFCRTQFSRVSTLIYQNIQRLSTLKRREEERSKRTVVFQAIQPTYDDEIIKSSVSKVTVTEIDESTTDERKALKDRLDGPVGIGSTTEALVPILMFDYARAVGAQSCRHFQRTERRSKISNEVLANNCGLDTEVRSTRSRNGCRRGCPIRKQLVKCLVVSLRSIERAA